MKAPKHDRGSILESLSRLKTHLTIAQNEKNSQAQIAITKLIQYFESQLKELKVPKK